MPTAQQRSQARKAERAEIRFAKAHKAATSYGAALRKYAQQIAQIVEHFSVNGLVPPHVQPELNEALRRYTLGIQPWATRAAARMVAEVNRRNLTAWNAHAELMSSELRKELATAPVGAEVERLMAQQLELITSLPMDAAQRVHEATLEALEAGGRYQGRSAIEHGWDPDRQAWTRGEPELKTELEAALARAHPDATKQWLFNRATLIARTETARTASVLTQARAQHVGAESYVWKTAGDWKVRASHQRLNGSVQNWAEPPLCDPPDHHAHPGTIWNCRCVALPIIS
jgi:SPP1 gp7 family putative phage head morphogenesis protein